MTDDRGKPINAVLVPHAGTEWPLDDPRIDELRARIPSFWPSRAPHWHLATGAILPLAYVATFLAYVGVQTARLTRPSAGLLALATLGVLALALLGVGRVLRPRRLRRVTALVLREGLCAHCGYNLHSVPVDASDGMRLCPECGAAWKNDRIHRSAPFTGDRFVPIGEKRSTSPQQYERAGWIRDADRDWQPVSFPSRPRRKTKYPVSESQRARFIAVRAEVHRIGRPYRYVLATVMLTAVPMSVWLVDGPTGFQDRSTQITLAVFALLAVLMSQLDPLLLLKRSVRRISLRQGLCPACLSILPEDVGASPEGAVRCLLCLAVWRRSPPVDTNSPSDRLATTLAQPAQPIEAVASAASQNPSAAR